MPTTQFFSLTGVHAVSDTGFAIIPEGSAQRGLPYSRCVSLKLSGFQGLGGYQLVGLEALTAGKWYINICNCLNCSITKLLSLTHNETYYCSYIVTLLG